MLIAFLIAMALGVYKVYALFNTPYTGLDPQTQHKQLQDIIISFLKEDKAQNTEAQSIYEEIKTLDQLQDEEYKNFNRNRFNQLLQQLFYIYEVDSLDELIKVLHDEA